MENERIITVTGKGKMSIKPNVTRVDLMFKCVFDTYDEAYRKGEKYQTLLADIMTECGLDRKLPKTTRFDIEKSYSSNYEKGHYTGQKLVGYELFQTIKIDLGMDNKLLTKVVRSIGAKMEEVEIRIGHTVKNPRPYQLKMLKMAVKDATEKARIMAEAAGCSLSEVRSIDYGEHTLHVYSETTSFDAPCQAATCNESSLDITPDDLEGEEAVTVKWVLGNK